MIEIESINNQPIIKSQANVTEITSKYEFKAYARARRLGEMQESWMSKNCDLTEEDIRKECESVRQELYDKYIAHTRK